MIYLCGDVLTGTGDFIIRNVQDIDVWPALPVLQMLLHSQFGIGSALLLLIFLAPLSAQVDDLLEGTGDDIGPVGNVEDDTQDGPTPEEVTPGWKDLEGYGLKGQVSEREPHDACELCFTVPGGLNEYQIYEYMETDGPEGAVIVSRMIPNPAPEITDSDRIDEETGERVWYIGTQAYLGPTDEEKWAEDAPLSTIELMRIQRRHRTEVMTIPGVMSYGIGGSGFLVTLRLGYAEHIDLIPDALEGVPVDVEIDHGGEAVAWSLHSDRFRPLPASASIGAYVGSGNYTLGSLGPHVVRDRPHVSSAIFSPIALSALLLSSAGRPGSSLSRRSGGLGAGDTPASPAPHLSCSPDSRAPAFDRASTDSA